MYGSYTIASPTYSTADVMTGGSGNLTLYIPYKDSGRVFIAVVAQKPNTTFSLSVEMENVAAGFSKFANSVMLTSSPQFLFTSVFRRI